MSFYYKRCVRHSWGEEELGLIDWLLWKLQWSKKCEIVFYEHCVSQHVKEIEIKMIEKYILW